MSAFLQAILTKIYQFWVGFELAVTQIVQWIRQLSRLYSWSVGVFLGLLWYAVTYIYDCITWLGGLVGSLLSGAAGLTDIGGTQIPGPLGLGFSICNAFLPLTELAGFVIAIGPIWMVAVLVRVVKSWIPTVN